MYIYKYQIGGYKVQKLVQVLNYRHNNINWRKEMKKFYIICIILLCFTSLAFGEGRGRDDRGNDSHRGNHGNREDYHHNNNNSWNNHHYNSWNVWIGPVAVPYYYEYYTPPPPPPCRYIYLYDHWGNYVGRERVCD